MFGDCIIGGKRHKTCPGRIQRWYHGTEGTGRNRKPAIIYLDEYMICDCKCHKPKTKRKKKTK
jgi:hypothetical protein